MRLWHVVEHWTVSTWMLNKQWTIQPHSAFAIEFSIAISVECLHNCILRWNGEHILMALFSSRWSLVRMPHGSTLFIEFRLLFASCDSTKNNVANSNSKKENKIERALDADLHSWCGSWKTNTWCWALELPLAHTTIVFHFMLQFICIEASEGDGAQMMANWFIKLVMAVPHLEVNVKHAGAGAAIKWNQLSNTFFSAPHHRFFFFWFTIERDLRKSFRKHLSCIWTAGRVRYTLNDSMEFALDGNTIRTAANNQNTFEDVIEMSSQNERWCIIKNSVSVRRWHCGTPLPVT